MFTTEKQQQLNGIISQLKSQNATQEEINLITDDFSSKYDTEEKGIYGVTKKFPATGEEGLLDSITKAGFNLLPSAIDVMKNLWQAVNHPIETTGEILKPIAGAGEELLKPIEEKITGKDTSTLFGEEYLKTAEKIVDKVSSYSDLKNLKKDLINNPSEWAINLFLLKDAAAGSFAKPLPKTAELIETGITKTPEMISKGTEIGKEVLTSPLRAGKSFRSAITPMDESVKTILNTPDDVVKLTDYLNIAKKAKTDNSLPTPMAVIGDTSATDALNMIQKNLKKAGNDKSIITKNVGKLETGKIVEETRNSFRKDVNGLGATFLKDGTIRKAPGREIRVSSEDLQILQDVDKKLSSLGDNPTLIKVDDTIDYVQQMLYNKNNPMLPIKVSEEVNGMVEKNIGILNSKLKTLGGSAYADINTRYGELLGLRNKLNKALGAEGNKGASLIKTLFAPTGEATRKLFLGVKEETGIDLIKEATLAKYAMEAVGDARQASMLETLITGTSSLSKRNILNQVIDAMIKKLQSPELKAKQVIKKK